jgi:N-acetyl-gamma-glutamyl-phosphate reductase
MIRVSIIGASGYAGGELLRWLQAHPTVEIVHLVADKRAGEAVDRVWPSMRGLSSSTLSTLSAVPPETIASDSDLVFAALPAGAAMRIIPALLDGGARVVDLGPDFRLKDAASYSKWYGLDHDRPELLAEAVYGVPELMTAAIRTARLVANPGCYPTVVTLALCVLLREGLVGETVIVDAKSGASGAGRTPSEGTSFSELDGNLRPYAVGEHRHTPEIEQALADAGTNSRVFFVPHLAPMTRGILASCYFSLQEPIDNGGALGLLRASYSESPFVRVLDELPQTKATLASNFCDLTVRVDERTGQAAAIGAIDNLGKGAAGQAVQNMNVMFDLPETEGLWMAPVYP